MQMQLGLPNGEGKASKEGTAGVLVAFLAVGVNTHDVLITLPAI